MNRSFFETCTFEKARSQVFGGSSLDPFGFLKWGVSVITNVDVSQIEEERSVSWVIDNGQKTKLVTGSLGMLAHILWLRRHVNFRHRWAGRAARPCEFPPVQVQLPDFQFVQSTSEGVH
jgi:hypothetical protein